MSTVPASTSWIVVDRDLGDRAADPRRDLRHARVDLRVVGRLAARGGPEPDAGAGGQHDDDQDDDANATLL
jgi:hypothetical protein